MIPPSYFSSCKCHPTVTTGLGEPCLNCKELPMHHRDGGYCRNSTRQYDWFMHRKELSNHETTI